MTQLPFTPSPLSSNARDRSGKSLRFPAPPRRPSPTPLRIADGAGVGASGGASSGLRGGGGGHPARPCGPRERGRVPRRRLGQRGVGAPRQWLGRRSPRRRQERPLALRRRLGRAHLVVLTHRLVKLESAHY
jgi:hypothetical protein